MAKFAVGDRVRFTAKFLRNTAQGTGYASKETWTVTGFSRDWAITDQELSAEYVEMMWTPDELAADPTLKFRRIAIAHLEKLR